MGSEPGWEADYGAILCLPREQAWCPWPTSEQRNSGHGKRPLQAPSQIPLPSAQFTERSQEGVVVEKD